ncbi:hypothetical protein ADUPG1_006086 [Aduncisulcus paluster]|uniref:DUF659 domain-containing protein n=1 Tax=Aduncisulcus paluster TaxID=2918883 RepID=A0ABQ5KIH8_9EUKA|nr:hypothetical protein ADUPG1_006086 [Aduncisulcus paluster]
MSSGIPIPAIVRFLDSELQEELNFLYLFLKSPIKLSISTLYDTSHRVARKSLEEERKSALVGIYSVILDKTISRGKNVLAILVSNKKVTKAVGYVDVGKEKDDMFKDAFSREIQKSFWAEKNWSQGHSQVGVKERGTDIDKHTMKRMIKEISWILACCPAKIQEVLPSSTDILCDSLKEAFREIGIRNSSISSIVTDREPLMVAVASQLVEEGYGQLWVPCIAHVLNTLIQHYISFFFEQIEIFLEDLNMVLSSGSQENRTLCALLDISPPRYTKVRWSSLLEEFSKIYLRWDEILASLKFKTPTEQVVGLAKLLGVQKEAPTQQKILDDLPPIIHFEIRWSSLLECVKNLFKHWSGYRNCIKLRSDLEKKKELDFHMQSIKRMKKTPNLRNPLPTMNLQQVLHNRDLKIKQESGEVRMKKKHPCLGMPTSDDSDLVMQIVRDIDLSTCIDPASHMWTDEEVITIETPDPHPLPLSLLSEASPIKRCCGNTPTTIIDDAARNHNNNLKEVVKEIEGKAINELSKGSLEPEYDSDLVMQIVRDIDLSTCIDPASHMWPPSVILPTVPSRYVHNPMSYHDEGERTTIHGRKLFGKRCAIDDNYAANLHVSHFTMGNFSTMPSTSTFFPGKTEDVAQ